MRRLWQTISWLALAALIVPSCLYLTGTLELERVKATMLVATIAWFVATPLWMGRKR